MFLSPCGSYPGFHYQVQHVSGSPFIPICISFLCPPSMCCCHFLLQDTLPISLRWMSTDTSGVLRQASHCPWPVWALSSYVLSLEHDWTEGPNSQLSCFIHFLVMGNELVKRWVSVTPLKHYSAGTEPVTLCTWGRFISTSLLLHLTIESVSLCCLGQSSSPSLPKTWVGQACQPWPVLGDPPHDPGLTVSDAWEQLPQTKPCPQGVHLVRSSAAPEDPISLLFKSEGHRCITYFYFSLKLFLKLSFLVFIFFAWKDFCITILVCTEQGGQVHPEGKWASTRGL